MKSENVKIGKAVIFHPIIGGPDGAERAVIKSEVFDICGTPCCKIDIRSGCVAIEALEEV